MPMLRPGSNLSMYKHVTQRLIHHVALSSTSAEKVLIGTDILMIANASCYYTTRIHI